MDKKKKLRKIALWLFAVSVVCFPLFPFSQSLLKAYPVILNLVNILLIIGLVGSFWGSIIVFFISLFNREKHLKSKTKNLYNQKDIDELCPRCGDSLRSVKFNTFNEKKYCYLCAAYYKNRFDVKNGELIEKKTNAKLHSEVIIHKRPLNSCRSETEITDFIINMFSDKVEIVWGVGWRGGESNADGVSGSEILDADYFETHSIEEFIEFLKTKSWAEIFLKEFDIKNNLKINRLFNAAKKTNFVAVPLVKQEQKYKSIENALEILQKGNYVLQNIHASGEFSSHDCIDSFSWEYSSIDEFTKCVNDDFVEKKKNTAAEVVWSSTVFTVKNKDTDFEISFYYGEHSDYSHLSAWITKGTKSYWDDVVEKLSSLIEEKAKAQTDTENKKSPDNTEYYGSAYKFDCNTIIGPKDENLKKDFNPNINNFTEPIYFTNGILSENEIHLGSYWLNSGDYEQVTVKKADDAWYVCSVAMWPVHRGASNGGYIEIKIDEEFLNLKKIKNTDDFLNEFLRGNTKSCIELVKKDGQTLELIDRICKPW